MRYFMGAASVAAWLLTGFAALAQTESQVVFKHKAWEVQVVAFDNATVSCVAQVKKNGPTFSIWADGRSPVRLQFYSPVWEFDSDRADVVVQIDRRAKWNLNGAELYENSVLFDLPGDDAGSRFLLEVVRGNTLKLQNVGGALIESWSLAGSSASISALIDCTEILTSDADKNPFN